MDDCDIPQLAANILIVTHGGLLRELIRHMVDHLGCECPGGRRVALRIGPNTAVSKFMISISTEGLPPQATCVMLHDKEHLTIEGISSKESVFAC